MMYRTDSVDRATELVKAALTWRRSVSVDVEVPKGKRAVYVVREAQSAPDAEVQE